MKLRTNKGKLHQTDAREYKAELHNVIKEALASLDVMITDVDNGFIIEMPHDDLGAIPIECKFVIKPLDFDIIGAGDQYADKLQAQANKLLEKKKGL